MPTPSVAELAEPTLRCLEKGITGSSEMRALIAKELGVDLEGPTKNKFINNHAWALVFPA
jgi:hypothetical protein